MSSYYVEKAGATAGGTPAGGSTKASSGRPPIAGAGLASKPPQANQALSRAIRIKEENKQQSLALKRATAESTLLNSSNVNSNFASILNKRSSQSVNQS